jgi:hypothetical protein
MRAHKILKSTPELLQTHMNGALGQVRSHVRVADDAFSRTAELLSSDCSGCSCLMTCQQGGPGFNVNTVAQSGSSAAGNHYGEFRTLLQAADLCARCFKAFSWVLFWRAPVRSRRY